MSLWKSAGKVCKIELLGKHKLLILMIILTKIKQHNPKWPYIPNNPYRAIIIGGSGSGKTNILLNIVNSQPNIDKIFYMQKIHRKQNVNI